MKGNMMNLKEVDLRNVYRHWKKGLGPYRCFFRSSPFVSLQTYDDFEIMDICEKEDKKISGAILNEKSKGNFVIVDLELDRILDLALLLNNRNNIKPILNVNLLFNIFGLIGTKENISRLINYAYKLEHIKTDKFVMLIPYDRYDDNIDVSKVYDKLNNQYVVGFDDLPTVDFLKELGYKGISIITKENLKEDLKEYIEGINKEINVNLVKVEN